VRKIKRHQKREIERGKREIKRSGKYSQEEKERERARVEARERVVAKNRGRKRRS